MEHINLSDTDAILFASEFKKCYNIDFTEYASLSFKRRLINVLSYFKVHNVNDVLCKINNNNYQFIVDMITVNATEFFRDIEFFKKIIELIIPNIINLPSINIWHAACSSGEEIVSSIILMNELHLLQKCNFIGTDINKSILTLAAEGKYSNNHLDYLKKQYSILFPSSNIEKYFNFEKNNFFFKSEYLKKIEYLNHDIINGKTISKLKFDIVFCRNVMIYFNQNLQKKIFNLLHNNLKLNGYLLLGYQESLIWSQLENKYELSNNNCKIFKKKLK